MTIFFLIFFINIHNGFLFYNFFYIYIYMLWIEYNNILYSFYFRITYIKFNTHTNIYTHIHTYNY